MVQRYDKIIIGAGLYGLYGARFCAQRGQHVLVLEYDKEPFGRATYINQARVHMGYHYPRSLTTAVKSAGYFRRFVEDFGFCIHDAFEQIYATSDKFSWTSAKQFQEFCKAADIKCEEAAASKYFKPGMCDGAFLTEEYTYDAKVLQHFFENELNENTNVEIEYGVRIKRLVKLEKSFRVEVEDGKCFEAPYVLNATYASVNQVIDRVEGVEKEFFGIKYELCEIILCKPSDALKKIGITVMDGPFFSIMPFGQTGLHSLTAVTFTPHVTSYEPKPKFSCQKGMEQGKNKCTPDELGNCSECPHKPDSAWPYMSHLADKYMKPEYGYSYMQSLYSMKPILKSSEVDDSRPTAIRVMSREPVFVSVLSGKINTVYDLDEYLVME
ncbi:FAD-dependent oxidoreductase [Parablautia muri]|uniref:FAD-binding oxidoreductase n=1 Tax=Parablautia muri TaxID=2320879 RepID=A0A9X5BFK1_9FIRM|nr:FAD-dependent oxidoreductase [Parablautia muri]NBJ92732.1 FAD-binding oxidoreductase [Parablautia muri]